MGLFSKIKDLMSSRLKGEDNFTMYANNIGFIVKYCQQAKGSSFKNAHQLLSLAGYINMSYYLQNGLITIETIESWISPSSKNEATVSYTSLYYFVSSVQIFAFEEQFKNNKFLFNQVTDQVFENSQKTIDECKRILSSPLEYEKELHKEYANSVCNILASNNISHILLKTRLGLG